MSNRLVVGVNTAFSPEATEVGSAHQAPDLDAVPGEDAPTDVAIGAIEPAVQWAVDYAAPHHDEIELAHVLEETRAFLPKGIRGELLLAAEHQLRDEANRIMAANPLLRVHSTVLEGSPVDELTDRAAEAELLVIGTHSLKRFSNLIFSTRAAQIVSRASVSVVIIPVEPRDVGSGIVVGVDGSPASLAAVEFAAAEADRHGESLRVVFAWRVPAPWTIATIEVDWPVEPEDSDRMLLAESVAGLPEKYPDLQVTLDMNAALPVDALIGAAFGARMLVVGTHGRKGFARFWLGSVSHQLILAMPCPLAIVRSGAGTGTGTGAGAGVGSGA
ncbi:nucleotide-binding universal stress UspA family protein [Glaciihabitans tibetensis]|uniref:Nucleotide-binding universal stress UspA family protein n=1 Tax=Glaciihabitans tibetensis TaxID=1266600 RepID=A0A2T0VAP9_9MICO|nr:universal stress protein [Glaciihabitans tibetensis]PRY67231.1 nucleotide-binding universal stress UspA family protein [Glaciihabitans tibetensis]